MNVSRRGPGLGALCVAPVPGRAGHKRWFTLGCFGNGAQCDRAVDLYGASIRSGVEGRLRRSPRLRRQSMTRHGYSRIGRRGVRTRWARNALRLLHREGGSVASGKCGASGEGQEYCAAVGITAAE